MAGVEIKDTNITTTGHSDRQIAIQKLADAMNTLAGALKEPDGAIYGIYIGHVAEPAKMATSKQAKPTSKRRK